MAIASSQQAFLTNALISTHKIRNPTTTISCKCSMNNDHESPRKEMQIAKLAMVTLATGILTLGSVDGALAGKSGGRVGGQAFRPSAPRASSPRVNNSR
ncbi:transmembrane protein [Thalictrum thalictroides]|uniref:Transmembrane protein n=1 Tax=Thalictrum thalictroides TaxID=46969 RepID=A0A7J6W6U8_THATH|nr:transmembrane protein [Thalictrum thalictroides]